MAIAYNTSTVRSGLGFQLDAANRKSYPDSGTSWFDLSGRSINCTTNGAVTYSNGYFSGFTSGTGFVSAALTNSNPAVLNHGTGDFTYSFWLYFANFSDSQSIYTIDGAAFGQFLIRVSNSTQVQINGPSSQFLYSVGTLSANRWYNLVIIRQSGSVSMRVDGAAVGTPTAFTDSISATTSNTIRLGAPFFSGQVLSGRYAALSVYDRALTAAEVTQNFDALSGRYGI